MPAAPLELWAGVECTRNRVGNAFHDQLSLSGHDRRADDLERFAALGVKAVRYPALWEHADPDGTGGFDWSWADERLPRLRELGVRPIVGFVHHGSGPRRTHLLDPAFARGLAAYARAFAERFPWVADYTPVNEPLTTARFSALYGHWYPHARDGLSFAKALLNQCRAVTLAMRAARSVRPDARLVQTDDLGRTYSTPTLAYQAEFENERRWLTYDLLCGRVDRRHPMGAFLRWLGVPEAELEWFRENQCPPDVIGVNHYVTSERYLDERVERYAVCCRGGNGRHEYADVEAVRVLPQGPLGPAALLRETWERYRRPVAVTEAHLGCTREEQVRWLWEVWRAAHEARNGGADVRAVTVWSLLGAYDWDSLVTRPRGNYEPGAFDVRGPEPRETALAKLARCLAADRTPDLPALEQPGWWKRRERLPGGAPTPNDELPGRPLLITGAAGTLGRALARACERRALPCRRLSRAELDIADPAAVEAALAKFNPWAVVNAAGYVRVDDAEREPDRCRRENVAGPAALAQACARARLPLVTFSSDLVFDGGKGAPYREGDPANPLSVYGRTKAQAEREVLKRHPRALVVRTSAFFGPWDESNFVAAVLRTIAAGKPFAAACDYAVSPTYVPDLAHACLDLLLDGESGVWHLAGAEGVTWAELAREAARRGGLDPAAVVGRPLKEFGWPAVRPAYSVLSSERGPALPAWPDALDRFFAEREPPPPARQDGACGGRAGPIPGVAAAP